MAQHHLLLALIAALSYGIESVFGFGGTVVFIGLSGLYFDFKDLIYLSMLVSCASSVVIILQSPRHISLPHVLRLFMIALPGVVIGTQMIVFAKSALLMKMFGALLVIYGVHGLLFPAFKPPRALKYFFVALGGFIQGLFTSGGAFVLMGYRGEFDNKTQLKATMAAFFLTCNIFRIGQTVMTGNAQVQDFTMWWWMTLPVVAGVMIGHRIHVSLPERFFQRALLLVLVFIGVMTLLK